ncbi:MAG: hypothetical protein JXR77_11720, partial [Lentisphaeria bacterium]|nr:hypothetical protein [Lentisphaeria bacterium]
TGLVCGIEGGGICCGTGAAGRPGAAVSVAALRLAYARDLATTDYSAGRICLLEPTGAVAWSQAARNCNDFWVLEGSRVLVNTGHGVTEFARDGTVFFD